MILSPCEDMGTYSTCSEANAGVAGANQCCNANGTNCNQARVVNQPCTTFVSQNTAECEILVCTDKVEEDGDEDDTFPVYGIVLIAVFGGLAVSGVIYYVIRKLQQSGTKAPEQSKREPDQTLIF